MCSSEEEATERLTFGEENMQFNFTDHSFFCSTCEEEYSPDQILDELASKANTLVEQIEGFLLLLPKVKFPTSK